MANGELDTKEISKVNLQTCRTQSFKTGPKEENQLIRFAIIKDKRTVMCIIK